LLKNSLTIYQQQIFDLMRTKTYCKKKNVIYFTDKYDEDFVHALYCTDEDFEAVKGEFRKKNNA
jgi:hypothetical protein